jgi:hypothetical protein
MLIAPMTIQISAMSIAWAALIGLGRDGWNTATVAPMPPPIETSARNTGATPILPGTGVRRGRGAGAGGGAWSCPNSRASTRLSISSPMRSTRPSATAVS